MKEFIIEDNKLDILYKYGWLDSTKDGNYDLINSKFVNKYNKECDLEFNFFLTNLRIKTIFNYYLSIKKEPVYPIHIYLYNRNGLYFIHGKDIYHHSKDFTSNRENDFNNIKNITNISENIENDIKKYHLMSDYFITSFNRDSKISEIIK